MKIGIAPRNVNMKLFNSENISTLGEETVTFFERSTGQVQNRAGKNTQDDEGKRGGKEDRHEGEECNERMGKGLEIKNRKGITRRNDNRI